MQIQIKQVHDTRGCIGCVFEYKQECVYTHPHGIRCKGSHVYVITEIDGTSIEYSQ